jgi:hypothetical protein
MKNPIMIAIITLLVGAGAGFFGGMQYQQSRRTTAFAQFGQGQGANRTRTGAAPNGFRPVNGDIIASDNNSITVKLSDGSSKIVILNDQTVINKASQATAADLKTGETVAVFGQTNSDGSVTAQNIQINPIARELNTNPPIQPTGQ